jgi:putative nucleotidyltransferase with HDIG domain
MNPTDNTAVVEETNMPPSARTVPLELEHLIRRVTEIPTLPSTVARILEVSGSETSSAVDLAKVIYFDQALAAKVLRIANSPFYGFSRKVKTLEHATVILGFRDIRNMALAMSVFSSFFAGGNNHSRFDRIRFWEHSLSCGLGAKVIAEEAGLNKTELFVAGLIHDLGKVVLDRYNQEGFLEVLEAATGRHLAWEEAERAVLGYTHADLAARLLEIWKFPPELGRPVAYHHRPWDDAEEPQRSAVLYLADILTRSQGLPDYQHQPQPAGEEVKAALGRCAELGLNLPLSFLVSYGGRLKGEADGMQDYLNCIITFEMVP